MTLLIQEDIQDALVTQKAFSIIDSVVRARDPGHLQQTNLWFLPGNKATTFLPTQLTPGWKTGPGKRQLSDWVLDVARWEAVQKRGAGDCFLKSRGLASAAPAGGAPDGVTPVPAVSKTALDVNQGIFVEFFCYGVPGTVTADVLQVSFGGGLILHVHSTGTADLEDQRPASVTAKTSGYLTKGQPLTAGAQSDGKTSLVGQDLGIVLLPYRRGRLLVTTTRGGFFEVVIGCRADASDAYKMRRGPGEAAYYVTTDAGQVTLTPAPSLPACLTANPLTYQLSGLLTSPAVPLPYDVAAEPLEVLGEAEQQDGTQLTLSVFAPDGSAFAPDATHRLDALFYQVAFAVPGAPAGSLSLYAPVLYSLEMKWERTLGTKTYGTNTIPTVHSPTGNVIGARLSFSRDRQQKTFDYTVDNPSEHYTSLKDLYNRRVRVALTPDGVDGGLAVASGGDVPPGDVFVLWDGYTDEPEFTDGSASQIRIPCSGRRKRLRSHLLNDSQKFDGMPHAAVARQVLRDAGVDDADMVIGDDGGACLDSAEPGEDPLWRPANGQSADDWMQHLSETFSGWVWDDIAGVFYYVPREYFTAAALADNGTVPTVYQTTPTSGGAAATRKPNPDTLVALADSVRQTSREPACNDLWVLGQTDDGDVIAAHYEDEGSFVEPPPGTPRPANWLGERRTVFYVSGSITTLGAAQTTLGVLAPVLTQAQAQVAFSLPDFQVVQLPLEGPVAVEGYGVGLITGLTVDLGCDRNRKADYVYDIL